MLLVTLLFTVLVVAGLVSVLYAVMDGMSDAAVETVTEVAGYTEKVARALSSEAAADADAMGLTGEEWTREAETQFLEEFSRVLRIGAPFTGESAFYRGDGLELLWSSSDRALIGDIDERERALRRGEVGEPWVEGRSVLSGLVGPARLGVVAAHVPVDIPGGTRGVLDIVYFPEREEAVVDSIRAPIAALAVAATLVMVFVMWTAGRRALRPVMDLRGAADSVDAGRLDVRLPEKGDHEIAEVARSVNRLIEKLDRRAEMQTRFIADVSHELSTPVAGIRGYTTIMKAWGGEDAEVRDEAVAAIDRESRRMAKLCGDLLSLMRSEQSTELKVEPFDANALCREVLAVSATRYHSKGLEFKGPVEGSIEMAGDPRRIETVLFVLVDNACKYTPPGGLVSLSTRVEADSVIFEVADTGVGIPAEDIGSIFERFYRSEISRADSHGGFGLGLAIAKASVESMGGGIDVRSSVGAGTTFTVSILRGRLD